MIKLNQLAARWGELLSALLTASITGPFKCASGLYPVRLLQQMGWI